LGSGITDLAVSTNEEAIKLVKSEIDCNIMMLSPTMIEEELIELVENNITVTIGSVEELKLLEKVAQNHEGIIKAQIKIDTGFARYGFLYTQKEEILKCYNTVSNIKFTGIFTHFSKPTDEKWTNTQFKRFADILEFLKQNNINYGISHVCSSTAFLKYPYMYLDAVRLGSIIQGRSVLAKNRFKEVGTFKSQITEIKDVPKGYNISYSNTYKTKKATRLAVVPVGYYDGFNKNRLLDDFSFRNKIISVLMEIKKLFTDSSLRVKINNESFKVIGRLGMYHSIIDITGREDINIGTEVILDIKPLQANEEIRREYL
jgi:alanine racemase